MPLKQEGKRNGEFRITASVNGINSIMGDYVDDKLQVGSYMEKKFLLGSQNENTKFYRINHHSLFIHIYLFQGKAKIIFHDYSWMEGYFKQGNVFKFHII